MGLELIFTKAMEPMLNNGLSRQIVLEDILFYLNLQEKPLIFQQILIIMVRNYKYTHQTILLLKAGLSLIQVLQHLSLMEFIVLKILLILFLLILLGIIAQIRHKFKFIPKIIHQLNFGSSQNFQMGITKFQIQILENV